MLWCRYIDYFLPQLITIDLFILSISDKIWLLFWTQWRAFDLICRQKFSGYTQIGFHNGTFMLTYHSPPCHAALALPALAQCIAASLPSWTIFNSLWFVTVGRHQDDWFCVFLLISRQSLHHQPPFVLCEIGGCINQPVSAGMKRHWQFPHQLICWLTRDATVSQQMCKGKFKYLQYGTSGSPSIVSTEVSPRKGAINHIIRYWRQLNCFYLAVSWYFAAVTQHHLACAGNHC